MEGEEFWTDAEMMLGGGMSPLAAYVAGAAKVASGVSLQVIFPFLRQVEEMRRNQFLSEDNYRAVLHNVYCGKLGLAKEHVDSCVSLPALAKRQSSGSLVLEHHSSFSRPIDIEGRSFAYNPNTGLITSKGDAEIIERMLLEQMNEDKEQMMEDEAMARELERREREEVAKNRNREDVLPDCQICMEQIAASEINPLDHCGHMFHSSCISRYFELRINESQFPIICPLDDCKLEVSMLDLKERLSPELIAKFEDFTFNLYVASHKAALISCPSPNCKYVFLFNQETSFRCPICEVNYCLRCMTEFHNGMTCEEFRKTKDVGALDAMFQALVNGQHFKQCPQCKFWVEKTMGCDHMRCRCGGEFCYKCGGPYGNCECMRPAVPQPQPGFLGMVMSRFRGRRGRGRRY